LVERLIKHKTLGGFLLFFLKSCDPQWILIGYQKTKRRCLKNETPIRVRITFFEMPTFVMEKKNYNKAPSNYAMKI
jgi:hypothetical protein